MNEERWVDKMSFIVSQHAQYYENVELALRLGELREADVYEGELPTGSELADILGVPQEELKDPWMRVMGRACLGATINERILGLSREERVRVFAAAASALDFFQSHGINTMIFFADQ